MGLGYPARMAGSLLNTIGLSDLVASSQEAYEALAASLATEPQRLAAIRTRLAANRTTTPLFDSALFTRHLEAAYEAAWGRWFEGLMPADIDIPA